MHRDWLTHEEKQEMIQLLNENKVLLDKLKQMCYSRLKDKEKTRRSKANYDSPQLGG